MPATTVVSGPHNVPTSTLLHPGQVVSPAQQVKSSTPPSGQAGNNTPSSAGQPGDNTPKRLHVSNIPFRFRDPDLRNLFGVSATNFCYQLQTNIYMFESATIFHAIKGVQYATYVVFRRLSVYALHAPYAIAFMIFATAALKNDKPIKYKFPVMVVGFPAMMARKKGLTKSRFILNRFENYITRFRNATLHHYWNFTPARMVVLLFSNQSTRLHGEYLMLYSILH